MLDIVVRCGNSFATADSHRSPLWQCSDSNDIGFDATYLDSLQPPRSGAAHFLMKTLPRVAAEMTLHVLAYNLTHVMNIVGINPLMAPIRT